MPVKLKLMHVKKIGKISRENTNFSAKSIKFVPVKMNFLSVKKPKKRPKSGGEIGFTPVKKSKKWPKMGFHGHFYFHEKKKTLDLREGVGLSMIHSVSRLFHKLQLYY